MMSMRGTGLAQRGLRERDVLPPHLIGVAAVVRVGEETFERQRVQRLVKLSLRQRQRKLGSAELRDQRVLVGGRNIDVGAVVKLLRNQLDALGELDEDRPQRRKRWFGE